MALPVAVPVPRVLRPRRAAPSDAVRPTRADINLGSLRHNLHVVRRFAGNSLVYGVLKADAYGHGAPAVARTLERAGIDGICVALLEEGIELREAGIRAPILIMGGYYGDAWSEVLARNLTPVVYEPAQIEALAREVRYYEAPPAAVHLKVDTGMARLGVRFERLEEMMDAFDQCPEVKLTGMMTHFANADRGDLHLTDEQCGVFDASVAMAEKRGHSSLMRHAANSAALMRTERYRYDMVRPGIALFGVEPSPDLAKDLRPVMRVRSEIIALRDIPEGAPAGYGSTWCATRATRIATIPMGYADGVNRSLSNVGRVLVRGRSCAIVGNVSMDLIMVDVTAIPGVTLRDEVVVLGSQQGPLGSDTITPEEIAHASGTIPWEVLTGISRRVPRFYREP
ncbi:MAG: alanine racemase [Deltaproteobacteria bacterium]|nr:alanine racemase [Deltaproteobacteria bacterium]